MPQELVGTWVQTKGGVTEQLLAAAHSDGLVLTFVATGQSVTTAAQGSITATVAINASVNSVYQTTFTVTKTTVPGGMPVGATQQVTMKLLNNGTTLRLFTDTGTVDAWVMEFTKQ
jgi:hypothetical protein